MKTFPVLLALILMNSLSLNARSVLNAGFFLTGAQIYQADEHGESSDSYRYTTNSEDIDETSNPAFRLGIQQENMAGTRQDRAITFELLTGQINSFEFNHDPLQSASLGSNYFGLNLFFNDTGLSFNPRNQLGNSFAGHLTAVVEINQAEGKFSIVNKDTQVQNYDFRSNGKASANGLSSFTVGEYTVTLASLSATNSNGPVGSFGLAVSKLQITATPEPATLGLGGLACVGIIGAARRRLRWKTKLPYM